MHAFLTNQTADNLHFNEKKELSNEEIDITEDYGGNGFRNMIEEDKQKQREYNLAKQWKYYLKSFLYSV